MRQYWRSSLFLYSVEDSGGDTPIIVFHRATVFTFGTGVSKKTLRKFLEKMSDAEELFEGAWVPYGVFAFGDSEGRTASWESRQVEPSSSRGLGFNWVEYARGERRGSMLQPEERVLVYNLQAFERNLRLGYSEFLGRIRQFGAYKRERKTLGDIVKSFWEWMSS